jgi:hypothetical protein
MRDSGIPPLRHGGNRECRVSKGRVTDGFRCQVSGFGFFRSPRSADNAELENLSPKFAKKMSFLANFAFLRGSLRLVRALPRYSMVNKKFRHFTAEDGERRVNNS